MIELEAWRGVLCHQLAERALRKLARSYRQRGEVNPWGLCEFSADRMRQLRVRILEDWSRRGVVGYLTVLDRLLAERAELGELGQDRESDYAETLSDIHRALSHEQFAELGRVLRERQNGGGP